MQKIYVTAAQLHLLLAREDTHALSAKARERLSWLQYYCDQGHSISETCRHFGIIRVTFYRLLQRFDHTRPSTLEDLSRRPHSSKHAISISAVAFVRACREAFPQMGKEQIAAKFLAEHGTPLSPSAVGRLIAREGFYFGDTPLHARKRFESGLGEDDTTEAMTGNEQADRSPLHASHPQDLASQPSAPALPAHDYFLWRMHRWNWRRLRRAFVIGSLLANLALIAIFLSTIFLESKGAPPVMSGQSVSASITELPIP
jgi:transposase